MNLTHSVHWMVSLSNGETFFEGKGKFEEIAGEPSPWQKLLKYLSENNLQITSLSLTTKDGRTFNLPSQGKNPKFRLFAQTEKPISFCVFRIIGADRGRINEDKLKLENNKSDWFTVIEAVYSQYKLQLWVDENNNKNCWTLITGK